MIAFNACQISYPFNIESHYLHRISCAFNVKSWNIWLFLGPGGVVVGQNDSLRALRWVPIGQNEVLRARRRVIVGQRKWRCRVSRCAHP